MEARSRITVSIAASLLFILLIKLTFPEAKNNKELVHEFWMSKTHSKDKYNVVVCGDSRVYRGVSPDAIIDNTDLNLTGINLGYSGSGFSEEYLDFALSKLDKNASLKVLVLGVTPHSLTREAFKNDDLRSYKEVASTQVMKAGYLSPILKHFAPYQLSELIGRRTVSHIQEYKPDGWVASSFRVPNPESAIPSYRKTFSKYQVKETEVDAFLKKVGQITSSGIHVIAFRPPSTIRMRALEDSISGFDESYIKQKLIEDSVVWMDFSEADFNSHDGSHLHFESAIKLSEMIGKRINELD